ncbi:hypothetical protein ACHAPD_005720 [Fusarium lateritium]
MYRAEATKSLKDDLEHICIENIQACILVGNNFFGEGDADAESLYFGLASRMSQILKLGVCNDADDGVTREVKRRIYWTCFIIDTWASGGSNLSRQFKWQNTHPRPPMDEYVLNQMKAGDPDIPDSQWKPGLWGYMVNLVEIYTEIQNFHQDLADTTEWDESFIDDTVRHLENKLVAFEEAIGPTLSFSRENLTTFVDRGLGRVFVAFHLGYHHYYTLLFYHYLDRRRPQTRNSNKYSATCKAHAIVVCEINRLVVFQRGCINSMNVESYRFDKWMVKFLIAHALALEDKVDDSWPSPYPEPSYRDVQIERGLITQAMITDIQNYSGGESFI